MYQRLLLLLLVLTGSYALKAQDVMSASDPDNVYNPAAAAGSATNPIPAGAGVMQKWVHSTTQKNRIGWNQSNFKSYRWGTMSFRLRFPNNYNPANKYPIVVFLHGAGEACDVNNAQNAAGANRENQDQLFWGAQIFEQRINQGEWNGFLLFPQLFSNSTEWDVVTNIPPVTNILDTLEKYNSMDPSRVILMGLSAGGLGDINFAGAFPKRVATIIPSSPEKVQLLVQNGWVPGMKEIPVWVSTGGLDNGPRPSDVFATRDAVKTAGGDFYLSYYATHGHDTWTPQWNQLNANFGFILSQYWNAAHKAQPMLYFQNSQFCSGGPISAPMGLTPGFNAYEWQYNNGSGFATIPGATQNTYTATQAGSYRVRYQRDPGGAWSDWTPNPVVISTKSCTTDTVIAEHFESLNNYYTVFAAPGDANATYAFQNVTCQNGIVTNSTEVFAQDATGRQGGNFMFYNTASGTCTYVAGAQIWRYMGNAQPVTQNTNYTLSFYIANHGVNYGAATTPLAALTPTINDVALTPGSMSTVQVGNASWKKLTYTWNSGSNVFVNALAILNNTASATGNDFVIDEISLVKAAPVAMPGNAFGNVALWAKANAINAADNSKLMFWTNSALNGNNLSQSSSGAAPFFKNNNTDNINFNPVVSVSKTINTGFITPAGFAGTTSHNAANIYMIAKFNQTNQSASVFDEATTSTSWDSLSTNTTGGLVWRAGNNTNIVTTPNNTIETNKPGLFTFTKDNINNTPNGFKQDIRKNGVLVASGNVNSTFTGSSSATFQFGNFDGNVAELIYVIDSQVTAADQNQVESYLALKYGITLGSTATPVNYVASNGATIWNGSLTYQNDVFGIGTDSATSLFQTSSNSINSGSGNGTGQSGKGNIVVTSASPLGDKDFLIMGNDAASLTQHIIVSGEANILAVGSTRIGREWKVRNIGGVGPVTLSFDTTGLGAQQGGATVNNYALMIDNDGDGNFSTGTIAFANATSASGKKIFFGNVTLNDNVVFTVITQKNTALLPARWLGFTAQEINGNAQLNWKTSDEMNVDRYTVEHSYNGISFSPVGTVAARNFSGENNYSFVHTGLTPGVHYYRIRRTDLDGRFEFTDVKTIKVSIGGANVQVRPNPVVGSTLTLAITTAQSTKTMVQVLAVDGKVMMQQNVSLGTGTSLVNLDINHVPAGVYMVQVQLNNEVMTRKFIRQR